VEKPDSLITEERDDAGGKNDHEKRRSSNKARARLEGKGTKESPTARERGFGSRLGKQKENLRNKKGGGEGCLWPATKD